VGFLLAMNLSLLKVRICRVSRILISNISKNYMKNKKMLQG